MLRVKSLYEEQLENLERQNKALEVEAERQLEQLVCTTTKVKQGNRMIFLPLEPGIFVGLIVDGANIMGTKAGGGGTLVDTKSVVNIKKSIVSCKYFLDLSFLNEKTQQILK